jgi:hypothetical protein
MSKAQFDKAVQIVQSLPKEISLLAMTAITALNAPSYTGWAHQTLAS